MIDVSELSMSWEREGTYNIGIDKMVGITFNKVTGRVGDDELIFECDEGTFIFYHSQSCCECVDIEDIVGDLSDLVGVPLVLASEHTNDNTHPEGVEFKYEPDSFTWTFYKFATIKGYVDVRWFGKSNGYYSERVSLLFTPKEK